MFGFFPYFLVLCASDIRNIGSRDAHHIQDIHEKKKTKKGQLIISHSLYHASRIIRCPKNKRKKERKIPIKCRLRRKPTYLSIEMTKLRDTDRGIINCLPACLPACLSERVRICARSVQLSSLRPRQNEESADA